MKKKLLILVGIIVLSLSLSLSAASFGSVGAVSAETEEGGIVPYGGVNSDYSGAWEGYGFRVDYRIVGRDGFFWSWDSVILYLKANTPVDIYIEAKFIDGQVNKSQIKIHRVDGFLEGNFEIYSEWNQIKRVELMTTVNGMVFRNTVTLYCDYNNPW